MNPALIIIAGVLAFWLVKHWERKAERDRNKSINPPLDESEEAISK